MMPKSATAGMAGEPSSVHWLAPNGMSTAPPITMLQPVKASAPVRGMTRAPASRYDAQHAAASSVAVTPAVVPPNAPAPSPNATAATPANAMSPPAIVAGRNGSIRKSAAKIAVRNGVTAIRSALVPALIVPREPAQRS